MPFDGPKKVVGDWSSFFSNPDDENCYVSNCYLENDQGVAPDMGIARYINQVAREYQVATSEEAGYE